jgi:hypothetical protein
LAALTQEFVVEGVGDAETGEDVGYGEVLLGGGDVDVLGFCAVGPGYEFLGGVVVFFALVLVEFTATVRNGNTGECGVRRYVVTCSRSWRSSGESFSFAYLSTMRSRM